MTKPTDLILTNGRVYTLSEPGAEPDAHDAVAVRDGKIVNVASTYDIGFLDGVETMVIDLDGAVVLPGFIDAHTHMEIVGRSLVHADLSRASSPEDAIAILQEREGEQRDNEWILGYGYDESDWDDPRYLTRADLDRVCEKRPVAAFREDLHTASLNSVALDRYGTSTHDRGVLAEDELAPIRCETAPDHEETRRLITAARDRAHALGLTGVHDMVRDSHAPRVYRELDGENVLDLRVRINYWSDHLDALHEIGAATNHGSEFVRVGGVKSFTDGSIGARTAKLSEPYEDVDGDGETGEWVVDPEEFRALVRRVDEAGLQFTAHAIGDMAIGTTLDAYQDANTERQRHRIEHAEVLTDDLIDRFAESGAIASVQPNFHKWAREDGLYEHRLGWERTKRSNRFYALREAGVPLAFGSDCMPLDPLFGVQQAVTAPTSEQRLSVTEALRAYTYGSAYAAFDEDRLGTIETGKRADLVVLDASPWAVAPEEIAEIEVVYTIVDGSIVFEAN